MDLSMKKCKPCEGGIAPLDQNEVAATQFFRARAAHDHLIARHQRWYHARRRDRKTDCLP